MYESSQREVCDYCDADLKKWLTITAEPVFDDREKISRSELAVTEIPDASPARENLEEILTASLRAREVVQQILRFSRKAVTSRQQPRIIPLLKETIKVLGSSYRRISKSNTRFHVNMRP